MVEVPALPSGTADATGLHDRLGIIVDDQPEAEAEEAVDVRVGRIVEGHDHQLIVGERGVAVDGDRDRVLAVTRVEGHDAALMSTWMVGAMDAAGVAKDATGG